jgi:glutamyl-Q tRNA(Asp) synthetase
MPTTRFAPSPSGLLHIGHAYSAWFSSQASQDGRFLLRIEDIDQTRCRPEFVSAIFEDLAWLGLSWEEPVRVQSDHFEDYRSALSLLSGEGLLYPCFCTRADIRASAIAPHGPDGPLYPGTCRALSSSERSERMERGEPYALRLDVEEAVQRSGQLEWHDEHQGVHSAQPELFGDVVLARKETPASYHLCVTVDDALQEVEVVTRGEDLFESTHVHRLLQALLELPVPEYAHHPLLRDEDGKKLSKRDGATTLRAMRDSGMTPSDVFEQMTSLVGA